MTQRKLSERDLSQWRWRHAGALALLAVVTGIQGLVNAANWDVVSPNKQIKATVQLSGSALSYRVEHGTEGHLAVVVRESPLGLRLQGQDFTHDLRFDSAQPPRTIDEQYVLIHGKRRECRNRASALTLAFQNANAQRMEVEFRAYDDGVAFRYRLPGGAADRQMLDSEASGFALPLEAKVWCAPSDKASTYSPAYETYYENEMDSGTPSPLGVGWSFPLLFRTADKQHWGLITEANVDPAFCGSRLCNNPTDGVYRVTLPDPAEGNGQGSPKPSSPLPWEMPWRVIILGSSPGVMVESTLVTDVCPPSRVQDTSWIRPGRVAWSWWSDNPSPKDAAKQKKFVDLAAEMGWEYVLVDANWTIMENGNIHDVLRYAKEKSVGVLLWYNSGGPHNVVTEKPRDCFTYAPVREFEFKLLQDWGVKGVKVDFFQSDKQDVIGLYHGLMQDAARHKIMVNFHGCTLPRGWERTYPNLMSMEAVRGEECYIFDSKYPEKAPMHNATLPFTRNAVGPMDYTPVGLSNNRYPHQTTAAHELALSVLFETGWLHFTDKVEAYLSLPPIPKQFLKDVPVAWDETRFVAGYPGQFAVVARRKGATWYLAGVNARNNPVDLALPAGPWFSAARVEVTTICDGQDSQNLECATRPVEAARGLEVRMLPKGGFAAVVKGT